MTSIATDSVGDGLDFDVAETLVSDPRSCRPHHRSAFSIVHSLAASHFEIRIPRSRAVCGRFARDFSRHAMIASSSWLDTLTLPRCDGGTGVSSMCFLTQVDQIGCFKHWLARQQEIADGTDGVDVAASVNGHRRLNGLR